jgi:DNA primase
MEFGNFIEHLKSSVDIVRVVGDYVRLRRIGTGGRWVGLCPFHTEKTPSFNVNGQHQFYKCFGCGAGGDVIKFVVEIERMTFWEAVKYLAEKNGIPLPKRSETADEETRRRARIHEMHDLAAQAFARHLWSGAGAEARAYLERRGVSRERAEEFMLGLSDRSGQMLVRLFEQRGFTHEEMLAAGLVLRRESGGFYDRFRGRLMFPIHSESGKVIAFGGRAMAEGDEPKYLNSPETPIYLKSHVLYNLHRARRTMQESSFAVLVEGYMDVIGVYSAGVGNVVATCGTALTNFQARSIKRHAETLVINYDPDRAGMTATERSIEILLAENMRLKVLELQGGLDPDEFVQRHGAAAYRNALGGAKPFFHWLTDRAAQANDVRTPQGKVAALQSLLKYIHMMPERLDRVAVADDTAARLGIERGLVLDEFRKAAAQRREARDRTREAPEVEASERILLFALLSRSQLAIYTANALLEAGALELRGAGRMIDACLKIAGTGELPAVDTVSARLLPEDIDLLHKTMLEEDPYNTEVNEEQVDRVISRLKARMLKSRLQELDRLAKQAEASGDLAESLRLVESRIEMERQLRAMREPSGA